jgi:hypothetical protein
VARPARPPQALHGREEPHDEHEEAGDMVIVAHEASGRTRYVKMLREDDRGPPGLFESR